jgi:hypothetical protein
LGFSKKTIQSWGSPRGRGTLQSCLYNEGSSTPAMPKPWMLRASCKGEKLFRVALVCLEVVVEIQRTSVKVGL